MASSGYYAGKELGNVEVATLAKDIILPKYDKKLNITIPADHQSIKISFTPKDTVYRSMKADFYIAIEIPNLNKNEKLNQQQAAPNAQQGGNRLNTTSYYTGNTIRLEIPKYLVMMFDNKIPKGTKFLVVSLADRVDANNIRIVSLYNDSPNQLASDASVDAENAGTTTNTVMGGGR